MRDGEEERFHVDGYGRADSDRARTEADEA